MYNNIYLIICWAKMISKYFPIQYNNVFDSRMWLGFIPYVFPICYITGWLFTKMPKLPLISKLGELSLEIYLINILILNVLIHYHYSEILGDWCYVIVPIVIIISSIAVQKVTKKIIN